MPSKKITFIGGGSYQWVPVLFRDIAVNPFLRDVTFVLHDIVQERNMELAEACRVIARKAGSPVQVETEDNLNRALSGASAVVLCISTGGLDAMELDLEIPKRHGIYQSVGDSTGPGGIFRTLRNIPIVVDLVRRMEDYCPDAWLLNLTNPMNQIVRAVQQTSRIRVVGLCHEFKSFMGTLEKVLDLKDWHDSVSARISGINHFAWITDLRIDGKDGLEMLRARLGQGEGLAVAGAGNDVNPSHSLSGNQIKFTLFERFGAVPYPGDRHLAEFFPYFLSEKTEYGQAYGVKLTNISDRRDWIKWYKERIAEWSNDDPKSVPLEPSEESLAPILAALIGGGPATIQPATLPNEGQVANLPLGTSVETLAAFHGDSVFPHAGGELPLAIMSVLEKHSHIQDLTVEAALEGDREKALQAMLADPLNNSNDYRDIVAMFDEMMEAHAALLPQFFPGEAFARGEATRMEAGFQSKAESHLVAV